MCLRRISWLDWSCPCAWKLATPWSDHMGSGSSVVVNPRSIVVVGAGYAGASFASKLIAKRWIRRFKSIVLVDRSEALHHCPCSCRAVVQDGWAEKLFYSYTKLTEAAEKQAPGVFRVEQGTVTAVNAKRLEYVNQSGVLSHLDFGACLCPTDCCCVKGEGFMSFPLTRCGPGVACQMYLCWPPAPRFRSLERTPTLMHSRQR